MKAAALFVVAALLMFGVACGGASCSDAKKTSNDCSVTPTASQPSRTKPTPVPPNVTARTTLEIKAPSQGETLTSPVTVEVASTHLIAARDALEEGNEVELEEHHRVDRGSSTFLVAVSHQLTNEREV